VPRSDKAQRRADLTAEQLHRILSYDPATGHFHFSRQARKPAGWARAGFAITRGYIQIGIGAPSIWRKAAMPRSSRSTSARVIRPHGLRHAAITAALDETNGNVRAAREFSGHASVEVLMKYDDNRKDVGGEVASKVIRRLANLFDEEGA